MTLVIELLSFHQQYNGPQKGFFLELGRLWGKTKIKSNSVVILATKDFMKSVKFE